MATHSSSLAWRIPWTKELGRLQSMGSQRVGHDWVTSLSLSFFTITFLKILLLLIKDILDAKSYLRAAYIFYLLPWECKKVHSWWHIEMVRYSWFPFGARQMNTKGKEAKLWRMYMLSCVQLFMTLESSSPGFSLMGLFQARIQKWVACPPPGHLPNPRIKPISAVSPGGFFTHEAIREAHGLLEFHLPSFHICNSSLDLFSSEQG